MFLALTIFKNKTVSIIKHIILLSIVLILQACNSVPIKYGAYIEPLHNNEELLIYVIRENSFASGGQNLEVVNNDTIKAILRPGSFTYFYGKNNDQIIGKLPGRLINRQVNGKNGEVIYLHVDASELGHAINILPKEKAIEYINNYDYAISTNEVHPSELNYKTYFYNIYSPSESKNNGSRYPNILALKDTINKINSIELVIDHIGEMNPNQNHIDGQSIDLLDDFPSEARRYDLEKYAYEVFYTNPEIGILEKYVPTGLLGLASKHNRLRKLAIQNIEFTREIVANNVDLSMVVNNEISNSEKMSNYLISSNSSNSPTDAILEVKLMDVGFIVVPNNTTNDENDVLIRPSIFATAKLIDNSNKEVIYEENIVYGVPRPTLQRGVSNVPLDAIRDKITVLPLSGIIEESNSDNSTIGDISYVVKALNHGVKIIAQEIVDRLSKEKN